ncbi:hypothetical protein [Acinetobacter sp. ANC 3791]|uniref:hypothetical protein n=1 Tax=Acinetobacter sp. ANC 3791 TaxID=2529836 RepID=UPI0010393CB9|nr:hypothetical protein [Acinetobacter sp. ANC 3791]TCB80893.1 hypothetical protein E0H90_15365 [Acinetobacter sp. ANC 3791]
MSHEVDASYLLHLANSRYKRKKLTKEEQIIFDREHERDRQRKVEIKKLLDGMLMSHDAE